ncbi:MAG: ABC transporter ATP-binding protein [Verrucomicrobiota bacterium]|jgi:ABC-2 type transport system ATP-binding protein|nr:ABC transporter ATP-binding protein [Verrucomicrobiota bacterium]MDI9384730.1 ABC transporter ATP-binding protein [Verrucomicrobiota bacterium]
MIKIDRITKNFGRLTAVQDLCLEVARGEIFGVLGHNGSGKSTTIGMMLGQVWPTKGAVALCGHDVHRHRARALAKVGAIFEAPAFYDYLSGWRNLKILSSYSGRTPDARILEVLDWVGLSGREHATVRTYSHGMRARLAIAQALLPAPDLLILDEPSDGLDPEGIHEMRETIRRLHRELGLTIFLSSHLLHEVEQLCTRIAVLNRGHKVFEGALAQTRGSAGDNWIHLRTGDFELACRALSEAGMLLNHREGHLLQPAEGVSADQIVRHLVGHSLPVHEIMPHRPSLEEFYLTLMNPTSDPSTPNPQ